MQSLKDILGAHFSSVRLQGYVPYSRRRVVQVRPPVTAGKAAHPHEKLFWQIDTVAAPWTPEEKWRYIPPIEISDSDDDDSSTADELELEKEVATVDEPETLTIFCDLPGIVDPLSLVGAGLRGRWALFGVNDEYKWWAFKAKDCEYWPAIRG